MVIAGAKYEPDTNIERDARTKETQKLLWYRTAEAIIGSARRPPMTQISDFVMYVFDSYLSLTIPPTMTDENPKIIRDAALKMEYSLVN